MTAGRRAPCDSLRARPNQPEQALSYSAPTGSDRRTRRFHAERGCPTAEVADGLRNLRLTQLARQISDPLEMLHMWDLSACSPSPLRRPRSKSARHAAKSPIRARSGYRVWQAPKREAKSVGSLGPEPLALLLAEFESNNSPSLETSRPPSNTELRNITCLGVKF